VRIRLQVLSPTTLPKLIFFLFCLVRIAEGLEKPSSPQIPIERLMDPILFSAIAKICQDKSLNLISVPEIKVMVF
jgi:hypothetical protein